jgi:hypothetical protein
MGPECAREGSADAWGARASVCVCVCVSEAGGKEESGLVLSAPDSMSTSFPVAGFIDWVSA